MSSAYFNMYKRFINAGRIAGMEEKLAALLGNDYLTTDEYEELLALLKTKQTV